MAGKNTPMLLVALGLVIAACTQPPNEGISGPVPSTAPDIATTVANSSVPPLSGDDFDEFMNGVTETLLARTPEEVTDLGLGQLLGLQDNLLNDLTLTHREETAAISERALARLDTMAPNSLDGDDAISAAVLRWYLEDVVSLSQFPHHEYPVNYITGAHTNFPEFMADIHPIADTDDADAYVARLEAAGSQMRQVADNVRRSAAHGIFPTIGSLQVAAWQIDNVLDDANEHPLVTGLAERLATLGTITAADIKRYEEAAADAVETHVLPGYRELLQSVDGTDGRPESAPGISELPNGDAYYEAVLRHHVSLDFTPEEIHQIGLDHVHRLTGELTSALADLGIDMERDGLAGAMEQAYGVSGFFPLSSESDRTHVLDVVDAEIENAKLAFDSMFTTYPTSDLVVVRPRPSRESGAGAYYRPPPAQGSRPGIYYLNLAGARFGKQTFRTTNYHEAIPGHHFQIALQRESEDLPLLQRAITFTGFAEGWALYAERLAYEAGLYADDPNGNLGRLQMEMLRAVRVVVDTGIHRFGWSRDEAIKYMVQLGFAESWASSEVDRYIVWPGQAPSYMMGMLEILRLRDEAEEALGTDFELASFHDAILGHGSLPLGVLDEVVAGYLADSRAAG